MEPGAGLGIEQVGGDVLPPLLVAFGPGAVAGDPVHHRSGAHGLGRHPVHARGGGRGRGDRKSTRLNSSHVATAYAVFCLKKRIGYVGGNGNVATVDSRERDSEGTTLR